MDHCFARALPFYAHLQNQRKRDPEERKLLNDPEWVDSANFLRLWVTSFSASTLLRSCPGIRERMRQLRGEMRIESNASGTRVMARIPIPDEATPTEPMQVVT